MMSMGDPVSSGNVDVESSTEVGISQEDLIEDAKFYQNTYEALLSRTSR